MINILILVKAYNLQDKYIEMLITVIKSIRALMYETCNLRVKMVMYGLERYSVS